MVIDQFDEMQEQSRKYPLVFAVSVHPFIIGQPFRVRAFRDAIRHIVRHRDRLWITTPGELARYIRQVDQSAIADNKRLGAVLAMIRDEQLRRGPERRSGPRRRDQRDPRLFKVG